VKVDQAQTLGEPGLPEFFNGEEDFRGVQAKLGVVARRQRPLALARVNSLARSPIMGFTPVSAEMRMNLVELGQLFDDDDHLLAQFAASSARRM